MKLLIILVVFIAVVALIQLMKISELSSKLTGKADEISESDNKLNARLMLVFYFLFMGGVVYSIFAYGYGFDRTSASEHGASIDSLLLLNWVIIGIVFLLTHTLLFFFAYKYSYKKENKAYYLAHDNKLELIWTVVPSIVLFGIIIYGLTTWNSITDIAEDDSFQVELYSKQFDWTARYPGKDGKLGLTNFNLVSNTNPLGIVTKKTIVEKLMEVESKLESLEIELSTKMEQFSDSKISIFEGKIQNLVLHRNRILQLNVSDDRLEWGKDDIMSKAEFHLPVDKTVEFLFRSRDVIHSAFMYDFRAQMNTVPGMTTRFKLKPVITTSEMRNEVANEEFNYKLTCNKICGAAHWNMTMDIIVETEEEYNQWLNEQKQFAPLAQ